MRNEISTADAVISRKNQKKRTIREIERMSMTATTCDGCGKAIPEKSRYCIHCGSVLNMDALISPQGKIILPAMPPRIKVPAQPKREIRKKDDDGIDPGKKAIMYTRSFVGSAFLTWIMYYVGFFIVGFIMNLSYLGEAKKIKEYTGQSPEGMGCLQFIMFTHVYLPIILVIILTIAGVSVVDAVMDFFGSLW